MASNTPSPLFGATQGVLNRMGLLDLVLCLLILLQASSTEGFSASVRGFSTHLPEQAALQTSLPLNQT